AELVERHAIDADVLPELNEDDLRELEIPLGHRKKLLAAITKLVRHVVIFEPHHHLVRFGGVETGVKTNVLGLATHQNNPQQKRAGEYRGSGNLHARVDRKALPRLVHPRQELP
ncbi:MAG: hypothetical protein IIB38_00095, partial [Candidatus Hydrogenedentes bacterium]|nr:hypothetical protein [Candidatus Hydrogenedentota bacterium]